MTWTMNGAWENYIWLFFSVRSVTLELIGGIRMTWLGNDSHKNRIQAFSFVLAEAWEVREKMQIDEKNDQFEQDISSTIAFPLKKSH